jgi:hypothetical protein
MVQGIGSRSKVTLGMGCEWWTLLCFQAKATGKGDALGQDRGWRNWGLADSGVAAPCWSSAVKMKGVVWMSASAGRKAQGRWQVGPAHLIISKTNFKFLWNLKFITKGFRCSKNPQTLHEARMEIAEQLSQFSWLQIPNRIHVIDFGIDSNLNIPWILKGFNPSGKNLINSLKIFLDIIFRNVNLVLLTCIQILYVPFTSGKWLGLNNTQPKRIWIWIWNFKPSYTVEYTTEVL